MLCSPPQARKKLFIWMGHLYRAFGPGTTCWPGGGLKCSPGVGGSKMASRGEEWLLTPPIHTYGLPADSKMTEKFGKTPLDHAETQEMKHVLKL